MESAALSDGLRERDVSNHQGALNIAGSVNGATPDATDNDANPTKIIIAHTTNVTSFGFCFPRIGMLHAAIARGITMADFSLSLLFPEEQQDRACSLGNSKQCLPQGERTGHEVEAMVARLGFGAMVVEQAFQAAPGELQRAIRDRRRQADVQGRIQAPSVRHRGEWLLRVAQEARRQAAVFHRCRGWQRVELCWPLGSMEES
jgi:hypothetical protein